MTTTWPVPVWEWAAVRFAERPDLCRHLTADPTQLGIRVAWAPGAATCTACAPMTSLIGSREDYTCDHCGGDTAGLDCVQLDGIDPGDAFRAPRLYLLIAGICPPCRRTLAPGFRPLVAR